jgi:hypothetical protein
VSTRKRKAPARGAARPPQPKPQLGPRSGRLAIECGKCKSKHEWAVEDLTAVSDQDAAEYFARRGWRTTPPSLCPRCSKGYSGLWLPPGARPGTP